MGDTENTIPPSKKRAAGRELSRDNPGLDDDEEEASGQETGTFKRASDEVLANRRIVKVRRSQTSSTPPSSNPFASIQLIPTPTDPTPPLQEPADIPQEPAKTDPEETKTEPEGPSEVRKPETETETETEKADNLRNDENTPASVNSFQQLSSSQNAFTGIVGTGFSSSTFSFGSITKTDSPTFPSFGFGTNGNHSSLFGTPSGTSDKPSGTKPVPTMQEVHVETGEENETAVFTADSVLFEFLEGGWKERGKGELKVNVLTTGTKKARLVMRARGNYRLILNASIFADMKLTNMEKKGVTFACVNSMGEGQNGLSTFALKFRDAAVVDEFRLVVDEQKGNTGGGAGLKTPENSPKASDE